MSAAVRIAHVRPTEIRALVVSDGRPEVRTISSSAEAFAVLVGGRHSFLYLYGGPGARGLILVANAEALRTVAKRTASPAGQIARVLGTTVAVGPARLRDGSTAWTSLTDAEVEFWSVALSAPARRRRRKESAR